jgi:plastocyanin
MDEADIELTQEMESVPQTIVETVIIPEGSGAPGCEETDECYIPSMLNISNGTTVSWENIDGAAHFATSGTPDGGPDGIFDSGMIGPNSVYEYEFSNVGEFEYYCLVHPWMTGIIVVE